MSHSTTILRKSIHCRGRAQQPGQSSSANLAVGHSVDPSTVGPLSTTSHPPIQDTTRHDIAQISPVIFAKDIIQPPGINELPEVGERLTSVHQLVHCLRLLRSFQSLDNELDKAEHNWLKAMENNKDEQERLEMLASNMLREFSHDELKDANVVAEVVCLAPVLEKHQLQKLPQQLFRGIEQSKMLDLDLINGLAQLMQYSPAGHLNPDDLVKTMELISIRLRGIHEQSQNYIYQLTLTVSSVLDAMADGNVKDIERKGIHTPLSDYLNDLITGMTHT